MNTEIYTASSFSSERNYFRCLKDKSTTDTINEYQLAIKTLLEMYNTTIYENRFTVGGAVEVFTVMLLRSVGIPAQEYGEETSAGDIILPKKKMLSVKSSFTGSKDAIKLVNIQGDTKPSWSTATLFVIAGVGLIYGDPSMLEDNDLKYPKDGLSLQRSAVDRFAENPSNLFAMDIAKKPPKETTGLSHKASTAVARQIMLDNDLKNLLNQIKN